MKSKPLYVAVDALFLALVSGTLTTSLYFGHYYRECRVSLDDCGRNRLLLTTEDNMDNTYCKLPLPTAEYHLYEEF